MATHLERDVRQFVGVRDLTLFQRFVRLCAARSGQLLDLTSLGTDCGVSAVTARHWLSVLETHDLVRLLPPYRVNFGKRLVKTSKLYFLDVGLMARLLGLRDTTMPGTTGSLRKWAQLAGDQAWLPTVVHGSTGQFERQGCLAVGWREFALGLAG